MAQAASQSRANSEPAAGGTAAPGAAAAPAPFVFDVHPDRPARRGVIMPNGKAVPFNEVRGRGDFALCRVRCVPVVVTSSMSL